MERKLDAWNKTFFDRTIQTNIGQGLKAQYDLQLKGQPMPQRLAALLAKIDEAERNKTMRR
jgi:hypothetical protein